MKWNEYIITAVKVKKLNWQKLADKLGIQYHTLFCGLYEGWLLNIYVYELARIVKINLNPFKRVLASKADTMLEKKLMVLYRQQQTMVEMRDNVFESNSSRASMRQERLRKLMGGK